VFGEAGVKNLVWGIILVFIAIILVVFAYSSFYGKFYPFTEPIYIEDPEPTLRFILYFGLGILFFGLLGGFEIGRL